MTDKWVRRWSIKSYSHPEQEPYTIAVDKDGNWGCTCWPWKRTRQECDHIREAQALQAIENEPGEPDSPLILAPPDIVLANVRQVEFHLDTNEVYVPLIPVVDPIMADFEATLLADLLWLGIPIGKLRERSGYYLAKKNAAHTITEYVNRRGRLIYSKKEFEERCPWPHEPDIERVLPGIPKERNWPDAVQVGDITWRFGENDSQFYYDYTDAKGVYWLVFCNNYAWEEPTPMWWKAMASLPSGGWASLNVKCVPTTWNIPIYVLRQATALIKSGRDPFC